MLKHHYRASNIVLLCGAMLLASTSAHAENLLTLIGKTQETSEAKDAELRLSVLEWSDAEKSKTIIERFKQNTAGFGEFLSKQDSKGYLFTAEALGYSIKYAWQTDDANGKRIVLAVTPALKTHNPYIWKQANTTDAGFSVLELQVQGEEAIAHTSMDDKIVLDAQGRLELQDSNASKVFARFKDGTPYYLKKS